MPIPFLNTSPLHFHPFCQLHDFRRDLLEGLAQCRRLAHNQRETKANEKMRYPFEGLHIAAQDNAVGDLFQCGKRGGHALSRILNGRLKQDLYLPGARHGGERTHEVAQAVEVGWARERVIKKFGMLYAIKAEYAQS